MRILDNEPVGRTCLMLANPGGFTTGRAWMPALCHN